MGRLIASMSVSLDGFAAGPGGSLDRFRIDEEVHGAFNEESRASEAFLFGRRMYELMDAYWPTADRDPDATPAMLEYAAIYTATPKVVFSGSLTEVSPGYRLVTGDALGEITRLRASTAGDLGIGGPTLAGAALQAGLLDEVRLYVNPVLLGDGLPFFPRLASPVSLEPIDRTEYASGVVRLVYGVRPA